MSRPELHINTGNEEDEGLSSQDEYSDEGESVSSRQPRFRLSFLPSLLPSCWPSFSSSSWLSELSLDWPRHRLWSQLCSVRFFSFVLSAFVTWAPSLPFLWRFSLLLAPLSSATPSSPPSRDKPPSSRETLSFSWTIPTLTGGSSTFSRPRTWDIFPRKTSRRLTSGWRGWTSLGTSMWVHPCI